MSNIAKSLLRLRFSQQGLLRFQAQLQAPLKQQQQLRTKASLTSPGAIPYVYTETPTFDKSPEAARHRKRLLARCGLIGVKKGMVPFFRENGDKIGCTVLEIDQVEVIHNKTLDNDGYVAQQVGYGYKLKNQTKQMLGHFSKAEVSPKEKIVEFQIKDESNLLPVGTVLKPSLFEVGKFVDLKSVSKGKGFAGVMKRWHFHGLKASHGVSLAHRSAGSTGQNQTPGRVLPGKKMAGRLGGDNVTIQNVEIVDINDEKGYILVKGPVAGPKGSYVKIQDAIKFYT
ncbi:hypothetical protein PACTADRAFT_51171 [Pachysolen tannophilus NRRL Y-2460]|uniref:Large ribosomal subunit protein uL3m n=1 Tax=Pachysolen tannophilus NRRL Y-2460 TaxID=669874 RepID=A0A1E4TRF9_PACTA|nr:hypothetical protein PACTADRAFT_51171 [Pachysolen tannophilus NRRL Y-2460]